MSTLSAKIEQKREQLMQLVAKYGFHHAKVITCSQELDSLLNLFEKTKEHA
ncbi:aspartyl-phosphate phosphatase Spo0E family protein [Bacillus sp. CGMCC 1.16541]|uniref:aspartyl-phosphate phosphatase Spo0E family protein n=1 Tax=Bacillus sp. CGMCC 1.16541 TaxID=2185143 RepID=UPI000D735A44|nr:aspartyl-phosphate phosphatase Spo0E family protein [Bacillus sp. CGMCC 1.16541]